MRPEESQRTHVIYASHYGHCEQYARWIAEDLTSRGAHVDLIEADDYECRTADKPLTIVFVGGNYAGTINGIEAFNNAAHTFPKAKLVALTVAWTSPERTESIAKLHEKNFPSDVRERASIFHARGGIDHSQLTFAHKAGMRALKTFIATKPESKRSSEDRETLEFWGKKKSFVTREAIAPVVAAASE